MTNEQTAVLLKQLHRTLNKALEQAKTNLPEEAWSIGKNFLQQEVHYVPALVPLEDLLEELEEDIKELSAGEQKIRITGQGS